MKTTADDPAPDAKPTRLRALPSWLITHIAVPAHRLASEAFAATGAARYHYALLAALEEFGPSSQAALGRRCSIDRSYVVGAVNELVEKGYVERVQDAADRRRNTVTITAAGVRQLERLDSALATTQDALLGPLSPAEREQLRGLLERVLDHQAGQ
ncbi:MarR family winged helix-turn-helix transcriptional regulator [Streptomyces sp. NPDC059679]|uniref:MarR family winged helix-turn-helix transcriptional regulator n=1 Tax=Streptomyces sp. NPDC059679 TaxID=3346903 RepID=UPI003690E280